MKISIFSFPLKKTWQKKKKEKKRLGSAGPTFSSGNSQLELRGGCALWTDHESPGSYSPPTPPHFLSPPHGSPGSAATFHHAGTLLLQQREKKYFL